MLKVKSSNKIKIRRSTLKDLDTLVSHRSKMWHEIMPNSGSEILQSDLAYRKWLVKMIRKRRFVGFLALVNESPVASGGIWLQEIHPRPELIRLKSPYLLSMYTKPEFRQMGIASAIVKEAMKWCKEKGYRTVALHASKMGRGTYSRLGWKRTWEMRIRL